MMPVAAAMPSDSTAAASKPPTPRSTNQTAFHVCPTPPGPDRHPKGRHPCRRAWAGGGAPASTRALASRAGCPKPARGAGAGVPLPLPCLDPHPRHQQPDRMTLPFAFRPSGTAAPQDTRESSGASGSTPWRAQDRLPRSGKDPSGPILGTEPRQERDRWQTILPCPARCRSPRP